MSERHMKLCREAIGSTDLPVMDAWLKGHPPELLLAMHDGMKGAAILRERHNENIRPFPAKCFCVSCEAVARYEELTND